MRQAGLAVLIVTLGAAPLAFGAVEVWAIEWLRFAAIVALGLSMWSDPGPGFLPRCARSLALPWAAMLVWGLLQSAPVPRPVLEALSPATARLYDVTASHVGGAALPGWLLARAREAGGVTVADGSEATAGSEDRGVWGAGRSLSIDPAATRRSVLAWATPLLGFLAAAGLARRPVDRSRILWAIATTTGILGATAVLQQGLWNGKILWIRDRPPGTRPLGPYVNPNHLANYLGIGTLVLLGLILAVLAFPRGRLAWSGVKEALTDRGWAVPRLLALTGFGVLAIAGLVLSRSWGGTIAFGAGLIAITLASRFRALVAVLCAVAVIGGVAAGLVSFVGPGLVELEQRPFVTAGASPSATFRLDAWGNTLRVAADHPWTGTGLGTFRWAYPAYQREGEWMVWREAHNEYLQFLAEGGLVSALIGLWGGWVLVRRILWPALTRRRQGLRWTTVAVAAALFAAVIHAAVEFGLQIPANAFLAAVVLGVLSAAAEDESGPSPDGPGADG